jgi:hypothetical protein
MYSFPNAFRGPGFPEDLKLVCPGFHTALQQLLIITVCDSVDLKNKRIFPDGSYGLFLIYE